MIETDTALPSVNWHITEHCNLHCRYCFATFAAMPVASAISREAGFQIISKLHAAGMTKITFVGGEPLLHPHVASWAAHAKTIGATTMLVTNGTRLVANPEHLILQHLDWLGLSIDSASASIQQALGRKIADPVKHAMFVAGLARTHGIRLKINTVVTALNANDDMVDFINRLSPDRWKIFQYLPVEGERVDTSLIIEPEAFQEYVRRHETALPGISVAWENNDRMTGSYVMMDPRGRFFDTRKHANGTLRRTYSTPVLDAPIAEVLGSMNYSLSKLEERGGIYAWTK